MTDEDAIHVSQLWKNDGSPAVKAGDEVTVYGSRIPAHRVTVTEADEIQIRFTSIGKTASFRLTRKSSR